jgi:hypothetical protein
MLNDNQIDIIVTMQNKAAAELAKLNSELGRSSVAAKGTGMSFASLGLSMAAFGAAYLVVKKGIIDSITAWDESEKVMAQTEAVITSTKGAAGMTAKAVSDLSSELQLMSTYSDEAIQTSENLLLTFTHIGKDIFPQATQTVLDMATAMGTDLHSASIQVGKAMQDPILGATALRRVGVMLTDQQQALVKSLVETGHGMEAQKIILEELSTEFGGSAAKQLQTFGGKVAWLKNQFGELQEGIGQGFTNALMQSIHGVAPFMDTMVKLSDELTRAQKVLRGAIESGDTAKIKTSTDEVKKIQTEIKKANDEMAASVASNKLMMADTMSEIVIGTKMAAKIIMDSFIFVSVAASFAATAMASPFIALFDTLKNLGKAAISIGEIVWDVAAQNEEAAATEYNNLVNIVNNPSNVAGNLLQQQADNAIAAYDSFGKTIADGQKEAEAAFTANRAAVDDYKQSTEGATGATNDFGDAAKETAGKIQDAEKKIKEIKKSIKDLNNEFKNSKNELKDQLKVNISENNANLGKDIAGQLISIQEDMAVQEKAINAAKTAEEMDAAKNKLREDQAILARHSSDVSKYADEIKAQQKFNSMDAIDQAKFTAAEQQKALQDGYEKDLKELKKAHKEKLKELKNSLDDAEKEYKKFFNNMNKYAKGKGKVSVSTDVSYKLPSYDTGTNYVPHDMIAQIHEGEAVVPKQYNPTAGGNGGGGNNFSFDFSNAVIGDKQSFINMIMDGINRKTELKRLGSTTQ